MISIVMPNYNKADYLAETIQSVLQQSYTDWELLVVDDGSTDDSLGIAGSFAKGDERIRLLTRERNPKGGSVCRNIGLHRAEGSYIIFMDSDDILLPTALEQRARHMTLHPELDFAVFPMGTFIHQIGDCATNWNPPAEGHLEKFLSHDLPWHTMQPVWEKSFLLNTGGYDEAFDRLQDVEFHTRVLINDRPNFEIAGDGNPDCMFRIDQGRRSFDAAQLLQFMANSSVRYIEKMQLLLARKPELQAAMGRRLNGTVFEVVKKGLHMERDGLVTKDEVEQHTAGIYSHLESGYISSRAMLDAYTALYRGGLHRLHGFHYAFKQLLLHI